MHAAGIYITKSLLAVTQVSGQIVEGMIEAAATLNMGFQSAQSF